MPLPDPILEELDARDRGRCCGKSTKGRRCLRRAPSWWDLDEPFYCRTHENWR